MVLKNIIYKKYNKYSKVIRNIFYKGMRSGINFFLLPVLTNFLDKKNIGTISLFLSALKFSKQFITANMQTFIWRKNYEEKDLREYNRYKSVTFILSVVQFFLLILVFFIFRRNLFGLFSNYYLTIPIIALFEAWCILKYNEYYSENEINSANFIIIGQKVLDLLISFTFILFLIKSYKGRILGYFFSALIIGTYSVYKFTEKFSIVLPNKKYFKEVLSFTLPYLPNFIFSWLIYNSDKYVINYFFSSGEVGVYSVAYKLGILILTLSSAITPFIKNKFFDNIDIRNNKVVIDKSIVNIIIKYSILLLFSALLLSLLHPLFYKTVINKEFSTSIFITPLIAFSYSFLGISNMFSIFIWKIGKTGYITISTALCAIINIIINIVFLNKYGIIVAAISTFIGYFIYVICIILISNNYIKYENDK